MRTNHAAEAARSFLSARAAAPTGPLAEDATFWAGVAYARANRTADAIRTLRVFLTDFPHAARAGEAAARLGWLLLDRDPDALDDAERLFTAALHDAVPSVRASAQAGLDRIHSLRR